MARIVSTAALGLVKTALGLVDAWPANPLILPDRNLSKTLQSGLREVASALKLNTMLLVRDARDGRTEAVDARYRTHRTISRTLRTGWNQLRVAVCGNRHQWRLR
jgi:hypothetical protein